MVIGRVAAQHSGSFTWIGKNQYNVAKCELIMKSKFLGYYRPHGEEAQQLWDDCLFVVDASFLLNIYGYSENTRNEILQLFDHVSSRMWIPHQFAMEFHKNRAKAIMEQVKNYSSVEKKLKQIFEEDLRSKKKHPFIDDELMQSFNQLRDSLKTSRERYTDFLHKDPILDRITTVFDSKVGKSFDATQLQELHGKAKARYGKGIPPGYADLKEKEEPDCYGDFIGWEQILQQAKSVSKPVILVTDDSKEDWWKIQGDRTVGPRPELIVEFGERCKCRFFMYSSFQFMYDAKTYLSQSVKDKAIEEVKNRQKSPPENIKGELKTEEVSIQQPPASNATPPHKKPTTQEEFKSPEKGELSKKHNIQAPVTGFSQKKTEDN